MATHSETLATWVAQLDPGEIPADVQSATRIFIADALAAAMSGSLTVSARLAAEFAMEHGGPPEATLIGHKRVSAIHAAFANSVMGRAETFDDVNELSGLHPGVAVVMTALAMAERQDSPGDRLIGAIVAGYELAVRTGAAVAPFHDRAGYHPTGTATCFGTAAAAAYLLGLDATQTLAALGLAGEQAGGFREYQVDGGLALSAFHAAKAAHSGILSALLASRGFPSPRDPLEGPHGFLRVMSPRYDPRALEEGLGEQYRIMTTALKPYPACRLVHGAVGATLRLIRTKPDFRVDDLRLLTIRTFRDALNHVDRPDFSTLLDAQFSIQFNVAVALQRGTVGLEDFEPDRLTDPATVALAQRIHVEHSPEIESDYPRLLPYEAVAELASGEVLRFRLDWPPGSPENPLSESEFWGKFESMASRALPDDRIRRIRDWVESLNRDSDPRSLGSLLAGDS
jgi:2-methylcitrate dehydratase PrpD